MPDPATLSMAGMPCPEACLYNLHGIVGRAGLVQYIIACKTPDVCSVALGAAFMHHWEEHGPEEFGVVSHGEPPQLGQGLADRGPLMLQAPSMTWTPSYPRSVTGRAPCQPGVKRTLQWQG